MQTDFVLQTKKENKVTKKKEKGKERAEIANGVMKKENVENQNIKATDPTIMDQLSHKIPIKQKKKGNTKGCKEKGKGKGKPRYGDI